MADKEHHVPQWDGSARWRRYTRETFTSEGIATKLVTRLSGPPIPKV